MTLKRCPFCGKFIPEYFDAEYITHLFCEYCGAKGPDVSLSNKNNTINNGKDCTNLAKILWNTRYDDDEDKLIKNDKK